MDEIVFYAEGFPAPQGSKTHVGGGRLVESSRRVGPWRGTVRTAATPLCVGCGRNAYSYRQTADGPLCVDCALGDELADEDEEP